MYGEPTFIIEEMFVGTRNYFMEIVKIFIYLSMYLRKNKQKKNRSVIKCTRRKITKWKKKKLINEIFIKNNTKRNKDYLLCSSEMQHWRGKYLISSTNKAAIVKYFIGKILQILFYKIKMIKSSLKPIEVGEFFFLYKVAVQKLFIKACKMFKEK